MAAKSSEAIIALIARYVDEHDGEVPGRHRFEAWSGVKRSEWIGRHWTAWGEALRAAGFEANSLQGAIPDDDVLRELALLTQRLGKFPTDAERRIEKRTNPAFPSHSRIQALGRTAEQMRRLNEVLPSGHQVRRCRKDS